MFRHITILCVFLLVCAGTGVYADSIPFFGSSQHTLTIITPADPDVNAGLQDAAKEYGTSHNTVVNIVSVKGRKKIVEEVTSGNTSADLVVIEKEYPLYKLTGLKTLEEKGLVEKSEELSENEADLIVSNDSPISSLSNLTGMRFAAVDLVNYHMPGGCLANYVYTDGLLNVTVVNQSGINEIFESVKNSSTDATVLWKSDLPKKQGSDDGLKLIPLPQYAMTNYLVLLKDSKDHAEASAFMDYVIQNKDEFF